MIVRIQCSRIRLHRPEKKLGRWEISESFCVRQPKGALWANNIYSKWDIPYLLQPREREKMHKVWQITRAATHINDAIAAFMCEEITCLSCKQQGLTSSIVYDIPKVLVLKTESADLDCVSLIDEVGLGSVELPEQSVSIEYCVQTGVIVLDEDQLLYLRKDRKNYLSYNISTDRFESIPHLTTQQTRLASTWAVFIYEANATLRLSRTWKGNPWS